MIDYYIYGYFKDIDPSEPSVRKVSGRRFECCGQDWYYRVIEERGKKHYEVTVPNLGVMLGRFEKLKDAKEWIGSHIDEIEAKCSDDRWVREELRFRELVNVAENKEKAV